MATIKFDADSIKERIRDRLKSKSSWANILYYSTNQRLIDAIAEEFAYNMNYNEILTIEGKWNKARQKTSLMAETSFFNYFPHRKVGSTGTIKLSTSKTFDSSYGINIGVDKYKIFSNNVYNFCVSETTMISSNDLYKDVKIVQGIPRQEEFIAEGVENESFIVDNDSIENNVFDVFVNNEVYKRLDYIREAESSESKVYTIENLIDFSGIKITFGDDFYGKKLKANDAVLFKYVETDGVSGNVESSNNIVSVVSKFEDSSGDSVILYCNNDEAIVGGKEYEDIESIRDNAPRSFKSGVTAITKEDYKFIVESFSFIKKSTVWGETEVNEDLGNDPGTYLGVEENMVYISSVSDDDGDITKFQEDTIRNFINDKKSPTDIVNFVDPIFIYIKFYVSAFIKDKNYSIVRVTDDIDLRLKTDYSIEKLDFKTPIYQSNYITSVNSVSGVGFHSTSFSLYTLILFSSAYTFSTSLKMTDISPNSVKIYINNKTNVEGWSQLAQDNGSNSIVGVGDYVLLSSTIDYNTGEMSCLVSEGLDDSFSNYEIRIEFNVDNENILPTARNQIISCGDNVINVEYDN